MKKTLLSLITLVFSAAMTAQVNTTVQFVDQLLLQGDYQNILDEDLAIESFSRACSLSPEDRIYSFMLAKALYGRADYGPSLQILEKLCMTDTANWTYSSYLSSIYMQMNRFDDAIKIYSRFLPADSVNVRYLNMTGFAYLKKGDHHTAKKVYNKALSVNDKDLTAMKNLAYLYSAGGKPDTAIAVLTRGIRIDSSDVSLFSLRAQIYYLRKYTKRAMDDYLVVLASGDSSKLVLKRIGIGYCNNFQPRMATGYLLKAHKLDSLDYETCSYLGQSYASLMEMDKSIFYYSKVIDILTPIYKQMGLSYMLLAETQMKASSFREALDSYQKAQRIADNPMLYINIANVYDEKLGDRKNAISYYQAFLDGIRKSGGTFDKKYLDSIRDRLEYLKTDPGRQ
ncbi:MAG: tetratricopeptide repeat protein [Bacteroidales bacterium]|nr:tetratricopeptide repeat protein [Bacteroidales bacterium]